MTLHRILLGLTAVWALVGTFLWLMAPLLAPALLPLCVVAPLAWYWGCERRLTWYAPSLATAVLVLAGTYLLINASWSPKPVLAIGPITNFFGMILILHVVSNTLPRVSDRVLRALGVGFVVGWMVGGLFLCIEILSGRAMRRPLMGYVSLLQPGPSAPDLQSDPLALMPDLTYRNISVLALLLFPAVLVVIRMGSWVRYRTVLFGALSLVAVTIFVSSHESSKVALTAAVASFALFQFRPELAKRLVIVGWVAANLCVVPVTALLYDVQAHRATWLPDSWRHRVVIWGHTSKQVANAPLLGAGMRTPRAHHEHHNREAAIAPGTTFALSTSWHSHNAYLQIWYETGAVGVFICFSLGLVVLWRMTKFCAEVQPYLFAEFTATATLAAFSYSIWAPWFMCSIGMACLFAALGAALPGRPHMPAATNRISHTTAAAATV